jgi:hypothetical protein
MDFKPPQNARAKIAAKHARRADHLNGPTAAHRDVRVGHHRKPNGWQERTTSCRRGYAAGITEVFNADTEPTT